MIRAWHLAKGWKDIGYHYFIGFDGRLERGRDREAVGAHCEGHNTESIGICLAGLLTSDFQPVQFETLRMLLDLLRPIYPTATLHAHNEFTNKLCPVFDIKPLKKIWDSATN